LSKSVRVVSVAKDGAAGPGQPKQPRGTVKSADRVLTLFELLGRWNRQISHSEIAEMLGIPKSSLTQLLKNLVARGWLSYSPPTKGYFLGDAIASLARGAVRRRDLIDMAQPILTETTTATGETTELHILRGDSVVVAAAVSSPANLMALMRVGDTAPLYATAGGKAILAALPEDMREEYYASVKLEPLTAKTVRSVQELRVQIDAIQRDEVAYCFEEYTAGVVGTARAVVVHGGVVLGAFDTPTPAVRYDKATAQRIAGALGQAAIEMRRLLEFAGRSQEPALIDAPHSPGGTANIGGKPGEVDRRAD
jgi:DNA-binding IclR family transcriptional regulator